MMKRKTSSRVHINLHSTMVLFKYEVEAAAHIEDIFTFHYGPIQIVLKEALEKMFDEFTFHYGPIQIIICISHKKGVTNLHSTMVLFK